MRRRGERERKREREREREKHGTRTVRMRLLTATTCVRAHRWMPGWMDGGNERSEFREVCASSSRDAGTNDARGTRMKERVIARECAGEET